MLSELKELLDSCIFRIHEIENSLVTKKKLTSNQIIDQLREIRESLDQARSLRCKCSYGLEEQVEGEELDEKIKTMPDDVQKWLSNTFTKKIVVTNLRGTTAPKFKSVANAIRAGITVEKLFSKATALSLNIPSAVQAQLKEISCWGFNPFKLQELSNGRALRYVVLEIFSIYQLYKKFKVKLNILENFLDKVEQGYRENNNNYHNVIHAADVCQTVFYFLFSLKLDKCMTDLEIFALIFSAMIHDYRHTGRTNNFHVMTNSNLALQYNDISVLENFHIFETFSFMKADEFNILKGLETKTYREFRALVIKMVLGTDMSNHFEQIKKIKASLLISEKIEMHQLLTLLVHTCDISHPAKPWKMHEKWTNNLSEEFFAQFSVKISPSINVIVKGEEELRLNLPYSPLCDKKTTHISESQIGFIDYIVQPCFKVLDDVLKTVLNPMQKRPSFINANVYLPNIYEENTDNSIESISSTLSLNKTDA